MCALSFFFREGKSEVGKKIIHEKKTLEDSF